MTKIDVSFSCVCPVIDPEFRHNIRGIEWSLRAFVSMRAAVRLFLRTRAVTRGSEWGSIMSTIFDLCRLSVGDLSYFFVASR